MEHSPAMAKKLRRPRKVIAVCLDGVDARRLAGLGTYVDGHQWVFFFLGRLWTVFTPQSLAL